MKNFTKAMGTKKSETIIDCGLSESEFIEREILIEKQRSRTRWLTQDEFDRIQELSNKRFPNIDSQTKSDIISVTDYNEKYKPKAKRKKAEEDVHAQVCNYLDVKYPDVIYTSDQSGLRMPVGLAVKTAKTRSKKYKIPDLIILKPSNGFCGLIIEVKKNHDEAYTKKGELRENEHIQKQWASLQRLAKDGYMAVFGCGYNECVKIIELYFKIN